MKTPLLLRSSVLALAACMAALIPIASASDLAKPELTIVTAAGIGNALHATGLATAHSAISQNGTGNRADIAQSGKSQSVTLRQDGNLNTVAVSQSGVNNSLELTQQGNQNQAVFNQSGGTRASLSQIGDLHRAEINQTITSPDIVIQQSGAATVVRTTQY